MSNDTYEARAEWCGGKILINDLGEGRGWGIEHVFAAGEGPDKRGGVYPLDYHKTRKGALEMGRRHARARSAPLYIEQEV